MSELFSRFIGSAPGYERSAAYERQAEQRQVQKSRAVGISEKPIAPAPLQVPEIRGGRITRWVNID